VRATFTVTVDDAFLLERVRELVGDQGNPADYFAERARDVADDELPVAFYGWPVEVAVTVEAGP
jgi:hypothetical protein